MLFKRNKPASVPVSNIEVLRLEPGDFLIVNSSRSLSRAQMEEIRKRFVALLPQEVTPVILDRGLELEVIRPSKPSCGCPDVVGVGSGGGEYCDDCHQIVA